MLAVVQARINSSRLPGKAVMQLGNKSVLQHTVNRLKYSSKITSIVVATSNKPADDEIENHARQIRIEVYRGNLEDVGSRLLEAATYRNADAFIRVSADSPFIDWRIIDNAISLYQVSQPDLVTNVFPELSRRDNQSRSLRLALSMLFVKLIEHPSKRNMLRPTFTTISRNLELYLFLAESILQPQLTASMTKPIMKEHKELLRKWVVKIGHGNN